MLTTEKRNTQIRKHRFAALLGALAAIFSAHVATNLAYADKPDELRVMTAFNKFDETSLVAATYRTRGLGWLRASRTDWSLGVLARRGDVSPFIVIAPVWRVGRGARWFADFSIGPTLIADPRLDRETLGGSFHFTSAFSVGRRFASRWEISLRAQHISNAGLHDRNPGLDSIGLSIANVPR